MKKILYLRSFTVKNIDFDSSDAIGYGITSSDAIYSALENEYILVPVPKRGADKQSDHASYLAWTFESYQEILLHLKVDPPSAIFIFHSFQQFPQEIKKMLYHLKLNIPVIGYTHGSHWDPTDTFRQIHSPDLHLTDLANLYCLDSILFVTQSFKTIVLEQIAKFNVKIAEKISLKSHVVGLPINTLLIDSFYQQKKPDDLTIVFNHAPIPSKNLSMFLEVIGLLFSLYPYLKCHITRYGKNDTRDFNKAQQIATAFPGRLVLSQTLSLADYYQLLWQSDLQVSTATHESLGIATLEAMYTHNCCILPNLGAYSEISNGITEHLYTDKNSLIDKLKYYLENPLARTGLASRLAACAQRYSMDYLYPHFIEVIKKSMIN